MSTQFDVTKRVTVVALENNRANLHKSHPIAPLRPQRLARKYTWLIVKFGFYLVSLAFSQQHQRLRDCCLAQWLGQSNLMRPAYFQKRLSQAVLKRSFQTGFFRPQV